MITTLTNEKWKSLLQKAMRGDAKAQCDVGMYYRDGAMKSNGQYLVKPDRRKALVWYERSAKQDDVSAQCELATLLTDGGGFPVDYQAAIRWYKKAIAQGNWAAAYNLGITYRDMGKPTLSYRWYAKAAEMGDNDAYLQLGLCNLLGYGVKTDFKQAWTCFEKVLNSSENCVTPRSLENASYWLAMMNLAGLGKRKRSASYARELLEYADYDADHEQANDLLGVIGRTERITEGRSRRRAK